MNGRDSKESSARASFFHRPAPVVTSIIRGQTPGEILKWAAASEADGAQGIAVDLERYRPEFRTREHFRSIMAPFDLPFMFFAYRDDKFAKVQSELTGTTSSPKSNPTRPGRRSCWRRPRPGRR